MGTKDIAERHLMEYGDVFADVVNVLLFDGKRMMVAEYFVKARENRPMEYRPQREPDHPDAFLKLMTILTGNAFFEKQIPVMREKYKMCDVMQAWWDDGVKTGEERGLVKGEARGLAKGLALGKAEGAAQGLIQGVVQLYR